jgi:hypothetical protein
MQATHQTSIKAKMPTGVCTFGCLFNLFLRLIIRAFQDLDVARYRTWDGKEIQVDSHPVVDGGSEPTDKDKKPSPPLRRRSLRTNINVDSSPAVQDGWLLSEEQSARKRVKPSSLEPTLPPTTSPDDPIAASDTNAIDTQAVKDECTLSRKQGAQKRVKVSSSAQNCSPTSLDDPIAISDTEDDAPPHDATSDSHHSSQPAASTSKSAGENFPATRKKSSTRGSASASAGAKEFVDEQGPNQSSKLSMVRDLARMAMVITPFGPGIFLRLRENSKVFICGCSSRCKNTSSISLNAFLFFLSKGAVSEVQLGYAVAFLQPEAITEISKTSPLNRPILSYPRPKIKGAIDIGRLDLLRLSRGCFLNDQLIDFYLRYLCDKGPTLLSALQREVYGDNWMRSEKSRFYFFNQFFYTQLVDGFRGNLGESDEAVEKRRVLWKRLQRWTVGVDLMSRDFLVIPINDFLHWSVAIVCNPGALAVAPREALEKSVGNVARSDSLDDKRSLEGKGEDEVAGNDQDVSMSDTPTDNEASPRTRSFECERVIPVGTQVKVDGLKGASYLNGHRGVVERFVASTGRYIIDFGGDVTNASISPANLQLCANQLQPSPTASDKSTASGVSAASETSSVAVPAVFPNGSRIQAQGFVRMAHLNGQFGHVESFCSKTSRYVIVIDSLGGDVEGACLRARHGNLKLVSDDVDSQAADSEETPKTSEAAASKDDGLRTCIIFLDSAKFHHSQSVFKHVRAYLQMVWNESYADAHGPRAFDTKTVPGFSPRVPQQVNDFDCGLYLLHFVENFIWGPPRVDDNFINQKGLGAKLTGRKGLNQSRVMEGCYFSADDITRKREELKKLLLHLIHEQRTLLGTDAISN